MLRPYGLKMPALVCAWNRDFSKQAKRRANIRDFMQKQLRVTCKGKGNKAWGRVNAMYNDPAYLIWPDYARNCLKGK